jgi:hypothetical protein
MDALFTVAAFLAGMALGRVQARAALEPLFEDLRRQVREALENLNELERQEGPKIEARILERMYRE